MVDDSSPSARKEHRRFDLLLHGIRKSKLLGAIVVAILAPIILVKVLPWIGLELTAAPPFIRVLKERFLEISVRNAVVMEPHGDGGTLLRRFRSATPLTIEFRYTLDEVLKIQELRLELSIAGSDGRYWFAEFKCDPAIGNDISLSDEIYQVACVVETPVTLSLRSISPEMRRRHFQVLSNWGVGWREASSELTLTYSTATRGKDDFKQPMYVLVPPKDELRDCKRSNAVIEVRDVLKEKGRVTRSHIEERFGKPILTVEADDSWFGPVQKTTYLCSDVSSSELPTCTFGMTFDQSGRLVDGWSAPLDERVLEYFDEKYEEQIDDLLRSSRTEVTSRLGDPHFSTGSSVFYVLPEAPETKLYELKFLFGSRWFMLPATVYHRQTPYLHRLPCQPRTTKLGSNIRQELSVHLRSEPPF